MRLLLLIISFCLLLLVNHSVAQDTLKIRQTAKLMTDAFVREDFSVLMDYTYPKVISLGGGKENMKVIIENAMNEMKSQGFTFRSITLGAISKIYKAGTELHCKIVQHLALNAKGGYLTSTSPLMCISSNGGDSWTFISTSNLDEKKIKLLFPDFNYELVLEKASVPIFSAE